MKISTCPYIYIVRVSIALYFYNHNKLPYEFGWYRQLRIVNRDELFQYFIYNFIGSTVLTFFFFQNDKVYFSSPSVL